MYKFWVIQRKYFSSVSGSIIQVLCLLKCVHYYLLHILSSLLNAEASTVTYLSSWKVSFRVLKEIWLANGENLTRELHFFIAEYNGTNYIIVNVANYLVMSLQGWTDIIIFLPIKLRWHTLFLRIKCGLWHKTRHFLKGKGVSLLVML
jgi:hypothetical protein